LPASGANAGICEDPGCCGDGEAQAKQFFANLLTRTLAPSCPRPVSANETLNSIAHKLIASPLAVAGLALLLAALAGCAAPVARKAPVSAPLKIAAAPVVAAEAPFEYEDDPIYRLLIAEFAGQRGHLDIAVAQYMALAESLRDVNLAQRATRIAVFGRDDAAALAAAQVWVSLAPMDMEARQIVAAMYIRHHDADAALEHLDYVLAHDHEEPGNRLRMVANLLGREEDRETALAVMGRLLDKFEDDTDALLAYALLAIRAEKLAEASAAMIRIAERTELSSNVAMAYLAVLQKQDKLPQAISWLEHILGVNPKQFGLRLIYARLLADANRYEEARIQFGVLSAESPDNSDIIFALGLLNLQANRADDAALNFEHLLKLETRQDEAHFYLGQVEEARDHGAAAIKHYQAIEGGNNYFAAQLRQALVLSGMDKVDEATAFLDNVVVEPGDQTYDLARAKGEILTQHERYEEALATYDQTLAGGGYNTELLYTRAMLAEKMGRIDILERDLRTIIAAEPDNAQALNALGYTLADRTERYDEAHALVSRALELSQGDFYILDSMGWVLYRLGRLEESIEYLEKARELRNDPEVAAHLGEVLWVLGNHDAARTVWDSALRDTPDDKKLLDVINRLAP
jgi:tetratricopeptide (TPR) repeat protein